MFFVFNKSKICAYLVSVGTVVILLMMGFYITSNNNTIQTSANEISNNINVKMINNIENNSKKYIISRCKRLIVPFIIWSFIYSIAQNNIEISTYKEIFKSLIKLSLGANSVQLYYIIVLLIFIIFS